MRNDRKTRFLIFFFPVSFSPRLCHPSHHFGFDHESPIVINVISFTIPPSSLARTLGSELAAFLESAGFTTY